MQHHQFYLPETELIESLVELRSHYRLQVDGRASITDECVTYFDTDNFRCFTNAQQNFRPRHTVQLRQQTKTGATTLEIASRLQHRTCKRRYKCADRLDHLGSEEHSMLGDHLEFKSRMLVPKVAVTLKRLTLVASSGQEFIRIQSNLCFASATQPKRDTKHAFVAVKLSPNCSSPFLNAMSSLGHKPSRSSLFEQAICSLYPEAMLQHTIQRSTDTLPSTEMAI